LFIYFAVVSLAVAATKKDAAAMVKLALTLAFSWLLSVTLES